jgi:hypothetical protein
MITGVKKIFVCLSIAVSVPFVSSACSKVDFNIAIDDEVVAPSSVYIAVFGDIQYYTNSTHIGLYMHSLNWIRKKSEEGIRFNCILHTGDITQNNSLIQYDCFYRATMPISEHIPYITMIGDHDYTWDGSLINDRQSTSFSEYVHFPITTNKIVASFEDNRMENIIVENTIYGQRLDLIVLEFGPREEVVAWASDYVKEHLDHHFILMNHEYLEAGGGRRTKHLKCAARLRNTTYTTPEQLWSNLIKCNDNIRLVLCGHVGGLFALTIDTNDFGREILQMQHNIQSPDYRYDNWLMLWEFPTGSDSANVFIYNTNTGKYYNNQDVLFKFRYRD